jgi:hypothetical protein
VTDTAQPQVTIPARWDVGGTTYSIQPEDQLYVWAVVSGQRSTKAIVDGKLTFDFLTPRLSRRVVRQPGSTE